MMPNHLESAESDNTEVSSWINCTAFKSTAFWLTAVQSGKKVPISDVNLSGRWSILIFYPKKFSEQYWRELVELGAYYDLFQKNQIDIYPVVDDDWPILKNQSSRQNSPHRGGIPFSVICSGRQCLQKCFDIEPLHDEQHDRFFSVIGPKGELKMNEALALELSFLPSFLFQKMNQLLSRGGRKDAHFCH